MNDEPLDETTRAEYMRLLTPIPAAELAADPAKDEQQKRARHAAIARLLTMANVLRLLTEHGGEVQKLLGIGPPLRRPDPAAAMEACRHITVMYESTTALLRKLLNVRNERPCLIAGMRIGAARLHDRTAAVVRDCDPTKEFVLVIGTRRGLSDSCAAHVHILLPMHPDDIPEEVRLAVMDRMLAAVTGAPLTTK